MLSERDINDINKEARLERNKKDKSLPRSKKELRAKIQEEVRQRRGDMIE